MSNLKIKVSNNSSAVWAVNQPRDLAEVKSRNEKWTIVNSVHLRGMNKYSEAELIRVRTLKKVKIEIQGFYRLWGVGPTKVLKVEWSSLG